MFADAETRDVFVAGWCAHCRFAVDGGLCADAVDNERGDPGGPLSRVIPSPVNPSGVACERYDEAPAARAAQIRADLAALGAVLRARLRETG